MQFHILTLFRGYASLISSSEKSFSSLFSMTPSPSLLGEAPSPPFLRYGVSRFSLPNTRPLTANEKDRGLRSG